MTLDDFSRLHRRRIDDCLSAQLDALPAMAPRLRDAMKYGLLLGGKRVRPFLVYAVGEMLGVKSELLDGPAAAVECIHAYSLLHDDLPAMDDDDLRRGQPTVHKAFDEGTAILAGDALQTLAFSILADHPMPDTLMANRVRMLSALARASGYLGMCGGQALDLEAEGHQVDLTSLERIHRHKTGALIRAAVRLGALSAGEAAPRDKLHVSSTLSEKNLKRIKVSKPGGTWRDWPEHLVADCHRAESGRTYPGVYGRMEWDKPAPTMTTQCYGFGNGRFGHPEQDRAITLREAAIIQSFPRDYAFIPDDGEVSFKVLGRLIGNAVPVDLGRAIARSINSHLAEIAPQP